ncbi:DUF2378 family protein [Cystobacter fuscus]
MCGARRAHVLAATPAPYTLALDDARTSGDAAHDERGRGPTRTRHLQSGGGFPLPAHWQAALRRGYPQAPQGHWRRHGSTAAGRLFGAHRRATVGVCAEILHPHLPSDQARYRIGHALTDAYGRTTMGSAVLQLFRMLGWQSSLSRITRGLQSGTNFLSAQSRFLEGARSSCASRCCPNSTPRWATSPASSPTS